jgi:hypothetical protein
MSRDINTYILKGLHCGVPFPELVADAISKLSGKSKNKDVLPLLRELCVHSCPEQDYGGTLPLTLLQCVRDATDSDLDRKIVRTLWYLLFEMISSSRRRRVHAITSGIVSQLQDDVAHQTGPRGSLSWRLLGRIADLCGAPEMAQASITNYMKSMQYPSKKKTFLGQKKASQDYENELQIWTSVFSAMRRARICPPQECMPVILVGCMSEQPTLAIHGLALLRKAVEDNPAEFSSVLYNKLKEIGFVARVEREPAMTSHLIFACRELIAFPGAAASMIEEALSFLFKMLDSPR